MQLCIGLGFDNHLLEDKKNNFVKICGLKIECDYKIIAKSDGDVVLHSLSDALLGSLGLGDIGLYFPTSDSNNDNLDSIIIINKVLQLIEQKHYEIVNVDLNIFSEYIEINPIRNLLLENLRKILKTININIKAKHYEKPIKELSCQSIVLLQKKINYEQR
ncbi:2-C-methyl-D-erythritol 2,4-cyclodiphosphate synthase [Mycoplasmoides alvi]|uniref:2-C-methyl-D-erythritol 2,4-cyclodiphosphate synthase n=1 Tax=Mycoplasmoides alvi TaxID=78580 RepID=UPI00051B7BA4|nr:2-C-methyl-D-erythritol 2,4-cyclodiphosphate synthase [Mycoplasmoides alvi]